MKKVVVLLYTTPPTYMRDMQGVMFHLQNFTYWMTFVDMANLTITHLHMHCEKKTQMQDEWTYSKHTHTKISISALERQ